MPLCPSISETQLESPHPYNNHDAADKNLAFRQHPPLAARTCIAGLANMSDNADGAGDPQITFKVKTTGDGNHTITMAETATVLDLKTKLSGEAFENIPVDRQRLIYSGRVMKNDDNLGSYKIKAGNTVHLVKSAASNPAQAPANQSAPTPQAVPSNMAAGTSANNLLAGLTGARFAGHAPLPNQNIFGPDGGVSSSRPWIFLEHVANPSCR